MNVEAIYNVYVTCAHPITPCGYSVHVQSNSSSALPSLVGDAVLKHIHPVRVWQ